MEKRPFFLFGDFIACIATAIITAITMTALFNTDWWMFPAMLIGMVLSMFLVLILDVLLFSRFFGAMEIMIPTMLGGMFSGMFAAMAASMQAFSYTQACKLGVVVGIFIFVTLWLANAKIVSGNPVKPSH